MCVCPVCAPHHLLFRLSMFENGDFRPHFVTNERFIVWILQLYCLVKWKVQGADTNFCGGFLLFASSPLQSAKICIQSLNKTQELYQSFYYNPTTFFALYIIILGILMLPFCSTRCPRWLTTETFFKNTVEEYNTQWNHSYCIHIHTYINSGIFP